MPAKKVPQTYREAVHFNFKDILKVISLEDVTFVEHLDPEQHADMCKFCHQVYHNPFFLKIITNFVWTQVMFTADMAISDEQYMGGKMMVQGVKTVEDFFQKYAREYDRITEQPESFDKRASFNKAKI